MKIFRYLDGSGNTYIINDEGEKTIEYLPVKPEYSSSGVYDGGEHAKKEISDQQYDDITSIMDEVIKNEASHISSRVKTSGMIIIKEGKSENTCILSAKSKIKLKIEQILHDILPSY